MTFEATERGSTSTFTKKSQYLVFSRVTCLFVFFNSLPSPTTFLFSLSADHSRILLPSDELDRKTTHRDLSVFTKWQKERNISDVVL